MPVRTRDFLLFLLTAGFLVIAIANVVARDLAPVAVPVSGLSATGYLAVNSDTEAAVEAYEAVVPPRAVEQSRAERLAAMRSAVAATDLASIPPAVIVAPEPIEVPVIAGDSNQPVNCSDYTRYGGMWDPSGLIFEVSEGARLLFREEPQIGFVINEISGEYEAFESKARNVVVQLPLRTWPMSQTNCIQQDVVGIALDGSLMRNSDYSIYRIFEGETLLGYALDGFPIYGLDSRARLDACGGVTESGHYRYQLTLERSNLLHCFAGIPVRL